MDKQSINQVPDSQVPQVTPSSPAAEPPVTGQKTRKHILWAIVPLLFLAALAGVYVWQHQKVVNLDTKVTKLNTRVSELTKQVVNLQATMITPSPKATRTPMPTATPVNVNTPAKFSGIITADGCVGAGVPPGDVGCSITVNSTINIDVVHGNAAQTQPWGSLINFPARPTNPTGKTVEVYARQLSKTSYTLEGSADYYVKISN